MNRTVWMALAATLALAGSRAEAAVRITEWMYQGANGEFIEFTNTGATPVDLAGWSFSDDARAAGAVPLDTLAVLAAGESFIITEADAATFRISWGLSSSVKVLGNNAKNLSRADEINIYSPSDSIVPADRLAYGDNVITGSIRTQNKSGIPSSPAALGVNNVMLWQFAVNGDEHGSWASAQGDVGSPGVYGVPEPAAMTLAGLAGLALTMLRRKTRLQN